MKRTPRSAARTLFPAVIAVSLATAGCASTPLPQSPTATAQVLTRTEVSYIGATRDTNPYIPQSRLVHGSPDEFVVVKLQLAMPEKILVTLGGSVQDANGTEVATLQSYQDMVSYWTDPTEQLPFRTIQARSDTLQRWYPPSLSFEANRGRVEYDVVFKGRNPIPRPATVTVDVSFGDSAPQEFSFPLPPHDKGLLGLD